MMRTLRPLLVATVVLAAAPAPGQVPTAGEVVEVPVRAIAGRLYLRADLRGRAQPVTAHLLLDLGSDTLFQLHVNTARLLELEPGDPVDIDLHDTGFPSVLPQVSRLRFLEGLTAEHAQALEEIPVVGIVGYPLLRDKRLRLDWRRGRLALLGRRIKPPGDATSPGAGPREGETPDAASGAQDGVLAAGGTVAVPLAMAGDVLQVTLVCGERTLEAGLTTADMDTWIDPAMASELGHPEGDLPEVRLGPVDVGRYVALRPGDFTRGRSGRPDVVLGTNFLSHFEVTIDPHNRELVLEAQRKPVFPEQDRVCFRAMVRDDAPALETFIEENEGHRLARDAGIHLLELRMKQRPLDEEALTKAVRLRARSAPAKRRARVMLDLVQQTRERAPAIFAAIKKTALELALASRDEDEDAEAVHRIRSEIGALYVEEGDLETAWRHLLGAAFGLPRDGMVNLRLGLLYERMGKDERAWSRFLQAAITEEAGPEGLAGLKRLADERGVTTPYDVDEMERALQGRIPAFEPASTYEPKDGKKPSRTVLCELFTGAHQEPAAAADLAFEGLPSHFRHGEVAILVHHLPAPRPEPLVSPAAMERAHEVGARAPPVVLLDGFQPVDAGGRPDKAGEAFRAIRDAVERRLLEPTLWKLDLKASLQGDRLDVEAVVDGPEGSGLGLNVYLAERTVLFPGASRIVLHRRVDRADVTRGIAGVPSAAGERRVQRSLSLHRVTRDLELFLDDLEAQMNRAFPLRPTAIAPRQAMLVAFLTDGSGRVLQAATWEANPKEDDGR